MKTIRRCFCFRSTDDVEKASYRLCDIDSTSIFRIEPNQQWARVVDVYDGDTITCIIKLHKKYPYKFQVRLAGIDTCELRSKNPDVRSKALEARQFVIQTITGCSEVTLKELTTRTSIKTFLNKTSYFIWIHVTGFDKYGRVLATIYTERPGNFGNSGHKILQTPKSLSERLVENGLAYAYDGKTKLTEEDQLEQLNQLHNSVGG